MKSKSQDKFVQGYICAVVCLIKQHDEVDTVTREVFKAGVGNMTLESLKKSGVDEYDLQILKQFWKELH